MCERVFLCLQIASMGTFQVLKLPLGFIRVLEWVSCNFHLLFVCQLAHEIWFNVRPWKIEHSVHML